MIEKLNNRYTKIGLVGLLVFVIARTGIAIANTYVEPNIPYPFVLSLIAAVVLGYLASKSIRY